MWVVKIGGSLLGSPELERWLELFVKYSDGNIVIVPGGGLFANAVREAQKLTKISDANTHKLAVLAMDQFGLLLVSLNPLLATAKTECEIDERTWQHRAIVWLPSHMVLADDSIAQSWDVTSDSLAAWLAKKLDAKQLVLVKSDKPSASQLCLKRLTEEGVVDEAFSEFILNANFGIWMLKKSDYAHFLNGVDIKTLTKVASLVN